MKAVNAVTTSWPGLGVDRPTFASVAEVEEPAWGEGALGLGLPELSPAEREVVALRVLLDLDGPTAARLLGISQTACSTRLSRALKRLEEMMSDASD